MSKNTLRRKQTASHTLPVVVEANKHLTLYRNMRTAIAQCHRVDECQDIIDKSVGLAAYYKQVNDTESERKFYQIKLRAWRRIGELFSAVDVSDCITQVAKIKKIKASFDEAVVAEFTDSRILEILKLAALPHTSFEFALNRITGGGIGGLWQHTPEFIAEREAAEAKAEAYRRARERKEAKPEYQKKLREQQEQEQKKLQAQQEQADLIKRHESELVEASKAALKEVGITLERKDRAQMKQVVFLIKKEIHAVMRQAAFDRKITMQEILRRGLKLWLVAHGYDFPEQGVASAREVTGMPTGVMS